ncbi:MAG: YicC family protein [Methylocystaceae bacterium]|nr:YicC family protein [Methylocystaceae bacterium]
MRVASMTGFSRTQGAVGPWSYAWELKSVNSKGLDIRLRLPPVFDSLEIKARQAIAARLTRGAITVNLTAKRVDEAASVQINRLILDRLLSALAQTPLPENLRPASLDGLLALPGVIEVIQPQEDETLRNQVEADILSALEEALDALVAARHAEGEALRQILSLRLAHIRQLTQNADAHPARQADAIRARLIQNLAKLVENVEGLDQARLHQEAVLLAVKSDIREELDRLKAHVDSVKELLATGGPIGRRLDFLAQELGRESNTLCAKSNDPALTAIGLDLKIEVEQFREQVQNIE